MHLRRRTARRSTGLVSQPGRQAGGRDQSGCARSQVKSRRFRSMCRPNPPAFGIDLRVDDSEGVAMEGGMVSRLRRVAGRQEWTTHLDRGRESAVAAASSRRVQIVLWMLGDHTKNRNTASNATDTIRTGWKPVLPNERISITYSARLPRLFRAQVCSYSASATTWDAEGRAAANPTAAALYDRLLQVRRGRSKCALFGCCCGAGSSSISSTSGNSNCWHIATVGIVGAWQEEQGGRMVHIAPRRITRKT